MWAYCKSEFSNNVEYIIVLFVETPRKFITAVINLRGVSTNKTIMYLIAMQTYKELNVEYIAV
jgi:hypothetical protein